MGDQIKQTITIKEIADVSDVLKYFFDDGSYIAIRPSGTEPKCKFYFTIKDENIKNAQKKAEKLKEYISELMNDK